VAEHIYEGAFTFTSGAAAAPIAEIIPATLAAGKRMPEIREIGIFNVSGVAAELGIGQPAAIGVTPATLTTVQAANTQDVIAGATTIAATWGTAPTAPTTYRRRFELAGYVGAPAVFQWLPGEFVMWSGAAINTVVIRQISILAVTYDLYFKVVE
jgi:hypothetical protein